MIPILSDLIGPVLNKVLDFIPDPKMKAEAAAKALEATQQQQLKLVELLSATDQKQAEINTEEAKSTSLFIAGWRPACGWVCATALAWVYIIQPFLSFILAAAHHPVVLPTVDFSSMSSVLMGMLGLGGLRSWEKIKGAEGNR